MNYFMMLLSLAFAGVVQAQACNTSFIPDTPVSRFIRNSNGTAFDKKTGLTWMRCALGQIWDGAASTCTGPVKTYNWQSALSAAEAASFAGFSDWRLPNYKELQSIVERRCFDPAINLTVFPGATDDLFWSASPNAWTSGNAWSVYFYDGDDSSDYKGSSNAVRLVRGGQ